MILHMADLHINDFRCYNIGTKYYRLDLYSYLGDWLVSLNPTSVVISGDLFHVSKPSAKTAIAATRFIEKFKCPVYITHGQHDLDEIRTNVDEFSENTYLSIISKISNAKYLHNEYITIEGLKYYFKGWEPTIDISNVQQHDIFVSHFTPQGVHTGSGHKMKSGFDINLSKFKLAFVGDIHKHQVVKEKLIVPGTPLQNSFSDSSDVGVILLDPVTLNWTRINTPIDLNGTKRLQFFTTSEIYDDPYVITKKPLESIVREAKQFKPATVFDPLSILESIIETRPKLSSIHREIINKISIEEKSMNLRFQLLNLSISNFLTIKNMDIDFSDLGGVTLISGENGTGKSSLLKAMTVVLKGTDTPKDLISWWGTDFKLKLKLFYNGHTYDIVRGTEKGSGITEISIDGKDEDKGGHNSTCDFLKKELSFINHLDLMIFDQDRKEFLSSYKFSERVKLISDILGLVVIDNIYEAAKNRYDSSKDYVSDLDREMKSIDIRISEIKNIIQNDQTDPNRLEIISGEYSKIKSDKDNYQKMCEQVNTQIATIKDCMNNQQKTKIRLGSELIKCETQLKDIENNRCYTCGHILDEEIMNSLKDRTLYNKDQINKELNELHEQRVDTEKYEKLIKLQSTLKIKVDENQTMLDKLTEEKFKIENSVKAHNQIKTLEEKHKALIDDYESSKEVMGLNDEYVKLISPDGEVMLSILSGVAQMLTNENFKIETLKQQKNKKMKPDFGAYYMKNSKWVNYDNCSGGEKCLIDLYILSKLFEIVGGCGLLVFDEFLSSLDKKNSEEAVHIAEKLPINNCFIVSHMANFPYYNSQIKSEMDNEGKSNYLIT